MLQFPRKPLIPSAGAGALALLLAAPAAAAERPHKPILHGKHWVAITGKPIAATACAMMFQKGGNAVDASCAMLAATSTMWDVLSWGGETQVLIYHPHEERVIAVNALGVAPAAATVDFFREKGMRYPPEFGPLAATTPGTPGGLFVMLAEWGRLSLADVLGPSIQMADGYPIEQDTVDRIERSKDRIREWTYSPQVFLTHPGEEREAPRPGEIFRQPDLAATLRKLVEAEAEALVAGKSREEAIYAAYDRFYRGDIARELVRAVQEEGGLITMEDLDRWQVKIEEPVSVEYKGVDIYKLTSWTQGPVMLQALNILEGFDLRAMGYNSARYIHKVTQAMNLAFADRDFYYGDPDFPPPTPMEGLLSKEYARRRGALIDPERTLLDAGPGDPYPFQGEENPFLDLLRAWPPEREEAEGEPGGPTAATAAGDRFPTDIFDVGTTSIQAADAEGWVVSATPSGGWIPAVIAGRTGVGLSQRLQSFVLDPAENPYNVLEPGKRPRVTLTPSLALKDGRPFLSFAIQGGDQQDQNLLQYFLNVVEFGMNVQEAAEAANFHTFQLFDSFGEHERRPGVLQINRRVPAWVRRELEEKGYTLELGDRTSGPVNAIFFDREHGTFWGGSSTQGDDYGVVW
jgi:gamma-glutamyltranspeptidase / glutathione hydrolase